MSDFLFMSYSHGGPVIILVLIRGWPVLGNSIMAEK